MTNNSLQHSDAAMPISNMIKQIRGCDTSKIQEACYALLAELRTRPDADSIAIIWQTDDIQMQRPDLSTEQCRDVLERLERRHDATIGINWDVIYCVADDCYPESDNIGELYELAAAD